MSKCSNLVTYYIPRAFHYREHKVRCGQTDYRGDRAVCDVCAGDKYVMDQIRNAESALEADNAWLKSAGWGEM